MEKLSERTSVLSVLRALRFASIRLRGRPDSAELAQAILACRAALQARYEAWLEAREERVAATAEIEYVDGLVDDEVLSVARDLLVLVLGNRKDIRFTKVFPRTPSAAIEGHGEAQERFVQALIAQLETDPDYAALKDRAARLAERAALLKATEDRRDGLYLPEAQAAAQLRQAADQARRTYNQLHPRLQLLFPDDPRLVDSFFFTSSHRSGSPEGPQPGPNELRED